MVSSNQNLHNEPMHNEPFDALKLHKDKLQRLKSFSNPLRRKNVSSSILHPYSRHNSAPAMCVCGSKRINQKLLDKRMIRNILYDHLDSIADIILDDKIQENVLKNSQEEMIDDWLEQLLIRSDIPSSNFVNIQILLENLGDWNFDVYTFSNLVPCNIIPVLGLAIIRKYDFQSQGVNYDEQVLFRFLMAVQGSYHDNVSFHNAVHAVDVLHSMHCFLQTSGLKELLPPLAKFVGLITAITHDIGHFGVSNASLQKSHHSISQKYPVSPMEAFHTDLALKLLSNNSCNVFNFATFSTQDDIHKLMKFCILGTDLCQAEINRHALKILQKNIKQGKLNGENEEWELLRFILHAADIGSSAKRLGIHLVCAARLSHELMPGLVATGEFWKVVEPTNEIKFLANYPLRVFEELQACSINVTQQLKNIHENISFWKTVIEE